MAAKKQCTICTHKARKKIDAALLVPGASIRGIARQFGVSDDALGRHVKNGHIAEKIAKAQNAQDIVEADDLLKELREVEQQTKEIITEARQRKKKVRNDEDTIEEVLVPDHDTALKGIRERGRQLDLKGRILGAFKGDTKPDEKTVVVKILKGSAKMDDL